MTNCPPVARPVSRLAGERGSMLLTAMLFAVGIAMVLGSYLALSRTSLKVAHRTFFANDAANLAEAGLEEALYCFNLMEAGTAAATAWSGWTFSGANAMRTLTPFNRDQNAIGVTKIYVKGYDGSDAAPYVISQAVVTPFDGGAPIIKTVHLVIRRTAASTPHGLVALNGLTLSGSTFVDSYISNPTSSPTGPWLVYSTAIDRSNASVAVLGGTVSIGSGQIKGNLYLAAGVAAPSAGDVTGTITTNYTVSVPFPTYPTAAGVSQSYNLGSTIPLILPRVGDVAASDGRYYYFCANTSIRSVAITANRDVTIVGTSNVGMPVTALTPVSVPTTSSLHVYMTGAFSLTGSAINASGYAGDVRIYTTTASNCTVGNTSQLVAWFQAPNAAFSASGNSSANRLSGFFLARTITVSQQQDIHCDESLLGVATTPAYDVTRWLDFQSAADKATVSGLTGGYLR
jgi:hypothetical protein